MIALKVPKFTFWRGLLAIIFAAGLYSTWVRFFQGLQASTNLSDPVPWGLWVGLNTLCGVGLSAGGFAIAAAVYILGLERFRPVLRTAILVSFLGYLTVIAGMMFELGLPWRIWHPLVMWNRRSVLFEVAWCVMLYTAVLALEFAPVMFEKFRWHRANRWHHRALVGLVMAGILLSSGHQSFLGGLYLITKGKLHPLWYSTQLPALFFISAIAAGLALTVMVLHLCVRRLGVRVDFSLLRDVSRVIVLMLIYYGLFRGVDLLAGRDASLLWKWRAETGWFWLEIALFLLAPLVLYNLPRVQSRPGASTGPAPWWLWASSPTASTSRFPACSAPRPPATCPSGLKSLPPWPSSPPPLWPSAGLSCTSTSSRACTWRSPSKSSGRRPSLHPGPWRKPRKDPPSARPALTDVGAHPSVRPMRSDSAQCAATQRAEHW
jgi:Ni/Fe-hydrogenase subunit HybB-like protein